MGQIKKNSMATKDMVETALMAAIIFVATFAMQIKTGNGYIHPGDAMVFVATIILSRKKSVLAAAIGMGLADLLSGYAVWAPFTLVIKAVMAYIAARIAHRKYNNGTNIANNVFAFIVAGVWMVAAYFGAGIIVDIILSSGQMSIYAALLDSVKGVIGNVIQAGFGVIVGTILSQILINALKIKTSKNN